MSYQTKREILNKMEAQENGLIPLLQEFNRLFNAEYMHTSIKTLAFERKVLAVWEIMSEGFQLTKKERLEVTRKFFSLLEMDYDAVFTAIQIEEIQAVDRHMGFNVFHSSVHWDRYQWNQHGHFLVANASEAHIGEVMVRHMIETYLGLEVNAPLYFDVTERANGTLYVGFRIAHYENWGGEYADPDYVQHATQGN